MSSTRRTKEAAYGDAIEHGTPWGDFAPLRVADQIGCEESAAMSDECESLCITSWLKPALTDTEQRSVKHHTLQSAM